MCLQSQEEIDVGNVSGDNWHHGIHTPVVEGIEYFNYSDFDVTITDKLGIEIEILRSEHRPERLEDRGKVIARVTRLADPRRVNIPTVDARLAVDREYLMQFKRSLDHQKTRIGEYVPETTQMRLAMQAELRFDFYTPTTIAKSNLLGITVRASSNREAQQSPDTPLGYIQSVIGDELRDVDVECDNGVDKGIRTLFSARLIDNTNRVGPLWTSGFGSTSRVVPVKDEEQIEGLYLAGGLGLKHQEFIPIDDLMDQKKLVSLNLHRTELDAKRHSTGEFTTSVITERDKLRKENKDLKNDNGKLTGKVESLENKLEIEKVNKAHSDFKQTRTMEYIKENNVSNVLGGFTRLFSTVMTNFKTLIGFLSVIKAM
ncbi:hypothetical protein OBP_125 [Pseudomonas phage OBP]|uniref:hypothetical protein n=1 Tax=Pseudomonas phage OBP TaxID=1124849 RepID=UPI000240D4AB|nr:hypothetical protein OBP_125 [Pseudomonas phage OBP]AEV89562.1 hypothetical protein OBP_125 [Pseudomonas phage OBP]